MALSSFWKGLIVGLAACAALAAGNADAKPVKLALTPTTKAPNSKGRSTLAVKRHGRGTFAVVAKKLAGGRTFDVIVGGVKVASFTSTPSGGGRAKFSTNPHGSQTLLGFDPRGEQVVVRDEDGDDDLVGDMPDEDGTTSACCLPDHDEIECEDIAPDACTAAGGTPAATSSCIPNPCETAPPEHEILCCIPESAHGAFTDEDPEVECEDVSEAECAHSGGSVVLGGSCDGDPCAPTPPAEQVACCVADGNESECDIRTPESCAAHGGTASGSSCDPDPCGGGSGGGDGGGDDGDGHH